MRTSGFTVLLVAGAIALASVSAACGEFIRQDRSPVTLVIDRIEASPGETSNFAGTLQSDVETNGGIISDSARVTMRVIMKDVGTAPTPVNSVTILRYRVTYRRADGRSTPGVDVPFPFDSATTFTVAPGSIASQSFELVRHSAKLEAPLAALAQSIGLVYSTIADVTFFGRDQAGNDLSVTGSIGVQFGNFADPD